MLLQFLLKNYNCAKSGALVHPVMIYYIFCHKQPDSNHVLVVPTIVLW